MKNVTSYNECNSFTDDLDVVFIKGPFEVNNKTYDFKLIDEDGEDYCTIGQMRMWNVKIKKVNS